MSRRILTLAWVLALALPLSGCWVLDELDSGKKLMDDHSAKPKEAKEDAADGAGAKGAKTAKSGKRMDAYFSAEEQAGTIKSFAPGEVSESIVACELAGTTQFMKREECAARGGRAD